MSEVNGVRSMDWLDTRTTAESMRRAVYRWHRMNGLEKPVITIHPEDYVEMVKTGPRDLVNALMLDYKIVSDPRVDRHLAELRPQEE